MGEETSSAPRRRLTKKKIEKEIHQKVQVNARDIR
jgi:hypothetical protein